MINFTPEKDKKAKVAPEQPNTKPSVLSDDELVGVSGGAVQLRPGQPEKPDEVDDEDLDGVSGGATTLKPNRTDTDGEVDDGSGDDKGLSSASVIPT